VTAQPETGPKLTPREIEIIALVAQGLTDQQIANHLFVSTRTINAHVHNIYLKTGIRSRVTLTVLWNQMQHEETELQDAKASQPPMVRISVDLTPELYRRLTGWVMGAAVELEVAKLSIANTVRSMIIVTTEDTDVSNAVKAVLPHGPKA
jgi:DNA-binding CsgD family transcriptional regulator